MDDYEETDPACCAHEPERWRDPDPPNRDKIPVMTTDHLPTGAEELRRAAKLFDQCREGFNDQFTAEELIRLYRAHVSSGWDFFPDQWSDRQIREALEDRLIPCWDDQEHPAYPDQRSTFG